MLVFHKTHQVVGDNMKSSSSSDDYDSSKSSAQVNTEISKEIVGDENIQLPNILTEVENIQIAIDDGDWWDIPTDDAFDFSPGEIGNAAEWHESAAPIKKLRRLSFGSSEVISTVESSAVRDKALGKDAFCEKNLCVESRAAYTAAMELTRASTNGSADRLPNRPDEPALVRFIRAKCSQLHFSRRWTTVCTMATLSNCAIIALEPELNRNRFNQRPTDVDGATIFTALDSLFFAIMLLEVLVGCAALGFARGDSSWFHSSRFHQIDLAVLLLSIMDYFLEARIDGYRGPFRVFRLFRLLKPVMTFDLLRQLGQILRALSRGVRQLATVFAVLALLFLAFAMFGARLAHAISVRKTAHGRACTRA
jgi:hypothetical protein